MRREGRKGRFRGRENSNTNVVPTFPRKVLRKNKILHRIQNFHSSSGKKL